MLGVITGWGYGYQRLDGVAVIPIGALGVVPSRRVQRSAPVSSIASGNDTGTPRSVVEVRLLSPRP